MRKKCKAHKEKRKSAFCGGAGKTPKKIKRSNQPSGKGPKPSSLHLLRGPPNPPSKKKKTKGHAIGSPVFSEGTPTHEKDRKKDFQC